MSTEEMSLSKELNIGNDFNSPSFEEWKKVVEKDLKGVPFDKKLITKTYEGINLNPLYTKQDIINLPQINEMPGFKNFLRGSNASMYINNEWEINQEIVTADSIDFNEQLKHELSRGQNSVVILLDKATQMGLDADYAKVGEVGNGGLSISGLNSFTRALKDIDLTKYPLHMDCGFSAVQMLMIFNAYLKNQKIDLKTVKGSIYADPLGYLAREGRLPTEIEFAFDRLAVVTRWAKKNAPFIRTIGASGISYHNSGASAVQELAFVIATLIEYIEKLTQRGLDIDTIAQKTRLSFGVGPFYFMEVAKFRAARLLWSKIVELYGGKTESLQMYIHAKTGLFNQTIFDPYVNMLRTTTEAFSAIIGGINALTTNPFDESFRTPDEFSRRIARNTQIILNEESHLNALIDPAGGSFYIEKLTDDVAKASWKLIQQIQSNGGMLKSIIDGFPQVEIEKISEEKKKDVAKRKYVIVGTNSYANNKESKLESYFINYEEIHKKRAEYLQKFRTSGSREVNEKVLEELGKLVESNDDEMIEVGTEAVLNGATLGEIVKASRAKTNESVSVKALKIFRLSEDFEKLRETSLSYEKQNGCKPKVFLATMGPLAQFKARADFSRGFFEIAGFDVIYPQGYQSTEEAVSEVLKSKTKIVVICSTDDTYPDLVPPLVKGIKAADSSIQVILAGYPKEQIETHKQNGVDDFIYLGADAYSIILSLMKKTGVYNEQ